MRIGYTNSVGLPFPSLALTLAILVKIAGGVALIAGYKTRVVAAGWRFSVSSLR